MVVLQKKLYLCTLEFEFHVIFMSLKIHTPPQLFKNVKTILVSQAAQEQVLLQTWPSLLTAALS
jgi:hypothetical protein